MQFKNMCESILKKNLNGRAVNILYQKKYLHINLFQCDEEWHCSIMAVFTSCLVFLLFLGAIT